MIPEISGKKDSMSINKVCGEKKFIYTHRSFRLYLIQIIHVLKYVQSWAECLLGLGP